MSSHLAPDPPHVPAGAPPAAHGLAGKLQHKVGPLPLWAWLGLGTGVILLLLHKGGTGGSTGGAAAADPAADTSTDPANSGLDLAGGAGGGGDGTNVGGFEDPSPLDPGFTDPGFNWPPDPGSSPNPPAGDPVAPSSGQWSPGPGYGDRPFLTLADFRAGQEAAPYAGATAGHAGSNVNGVVVHSGNSPAGRIAIATDTPTYTPYGAQTSHASSFAALPSTTKSRGTFLE